MRAVCRSLVRIHACGIVHRDIKSRCATKEMMQPCVHIISLVALRDIKNQRDDATLPMLHLHVISLVALRDMKSRHLPSVPRWFNVHTLCPTRTRPHAQRKNSVPRLSCDPPSFHAHVPV